MPPASITETVEVKISTAQIDTEWYELSYELTNSNSSHSYVLRLSNSPKETIQNLDRAEKLFMTVINELSWSSTLVNKSKISSDVQRPFSITNIDHLSFLAKLDDISKRLNTDRIPGSELYNASEIFSWLAFFKRANQNKSIRNILAERAISSYLLAVSTKSQDLHSQYTKGLLLIGMGYPGASASVLLSINEPDGLTMALIAFIQLRIDVIDSLIENGSLNEELGLYLRARTYDKAGYSTASNQAYRSISKDYPDFLLAFDYFLAEGSVGYNNRYMNSYIEDLLSTHISIIEKYTDTEWIRENLDFQFLLKQPVSKKDAPSKWLKVHSKLLKNTSPEHVITSLIDVDFILTYLREEMLNAMYLNHRHQQDLLGLLEAAQRISNEVSDAYPDSETAKVLQIKQFIAQGDLDALEAHLTKYNPEGLSDYLIGVLLEGHMEINPTWPRYYKIIPLMHAYNSQVNPTPGRFIELSYIYRRNNFKPYHENAIKFALEADSYNWLVYSFALWAGIEDESVADGEIKLGDSYGYLCAYANWLRNVNNYDEAIAYLRRAVKEAPNEGLAYKYMGQVYREMKKYDLAIDILKSYLETGDHYLRTVGVRNELAEIYLELGRFKQAYELYKDGGHSGYETALISFAKATEASSNIIAAEKYYKQAVDRYPGGTAPVELALYYWRNKNYQTALNTIRKYKRYAHETYYHERVIEFFSNEGKPEVAVELLKRLEDENEVPYTYLYFAGDLEKTGHWKLSVDLLEPLLRIRHLIENDQIQYFGAPYYDYYARNAPEFVAYALETIVDSYGDNAASLYFTAASLNSMGYYKAAIELLKHVKETDVRFYSASLQLMGMAWRMSGKDPILKQDLLKKIQNLQDNSWHKAHVKYLLEEIDKDEILKQARDPVSRCELYHDLGIIDIGSDNAERGIRYLLAAIELNAINCGYRVWAYETLKNM